MDSCLCRNDDASCRKSRTHAGLSPSSLRSLPLTGTGGGDTSSSSQQVQPGTSAKPEKQPITKGEHKESTLVLELDENTEVLDESTLVLAESAKEADESTRVLDEKAH